MHVWLLLESLGCCWFEYLSPCCSWNVLLTQTARQYVTVDWATDARGTFASLLIDFFLFSFISFPACSFGKTSLLGFPPPPFSSALPIDSTLHSLNMCSTYHWLHLPFCKLRCPVALAACGCMQPQSFLLGQKNVPLSLFTSFWYWKIFSLSSCKTLHFQTWSNLQIWPFLHPQIFKNIYLLYILMWDTK